MAPFLKLGSAKFNDSWNELRWQRLLSWSWQKDSKMNEKYKSRCPNFCINVTWNKKSRAVCRLKYGYTLRRNSIKDILVQVAFRWCGVTSFMSRITLAIRPLIILNSRHLGQIPPTSSPLSLHMLIEIALHLLRSSDPQARTGQTQAQRWAPRRHRSRDHAFRIRHEQYRRFRWWREVIHNQALVLANEGF